MLITPTTRPTSRSTTTRRAFALSGAASAALLAACGPHVRPGAASSSGSTITTDAQPGDALNAVRGFQAVQTPVPTPLPVTIRPPDPQASGRLWFDPTPGLPPENGEYESGFWYRQTARPGVYWHFSAVTPNQFTQTVIGPNDLPAEPPPPTRAGQRHVVQVIRSDGRIAGYWVWNAARRAGALPAPRWELVDDGRPHVLAG